MMADIPNPAPVRTRTADEIADEIAKNIASGGSADLLGEIALKVFDKLRVIKPDHVIDEVVRSRLATYLCGSPK
jgi:hypothetical protein